MREMKIAMIGAGSVGQTLGATLAQNGHDVMIGVRDPGGDALTKARNNAETLGEWTAKTGAKVGSFADAAKHGEIVFNVTSGGGSLEALAAAGAANLKGKVLIDVANPLDFSQGMPPFLMPRYAGPTSLAEQIQAAFPDTHVVKAFNTIAATVMVNPGLVPGDHDLFIAGNDAGAKAAVSDLARQEFGWQHIVDLGDIVGARATESLLPIWVRIWTTTGGFMHNFHLAKG
jgi:8-hydroxy-5-deazaflavin:NADPH oxidoreductase